MMMPRIWIVPTCVVNTSDRHCALMYKYRRGEGGKGGLTGMGVIDGSNFPASQARSPSHSFLVQLDGRRLKII